MTYRSNSRPPNPRKQKGALTMITAILVLVLLTELIFYAVQVGVFEQRKSSNELDQKQAFHTADSAIQVAKQFFAANSTLAGSYIADQRADGTDGWLSADGLRWLPCEGSGYEDDTTQQHPCWGEPVAELRDNSYFYFFDNSNELPIDPNSYSASGNETVTTHALLCMLDIDRSKDPIVQGCTETAPADPKYPQAGEQDRRYFLITLLARGEADCDANGDNCRAEALISEKIGTFGPGADDGGPGAPLTARTNVPLSGTVEIVPNPNGGGVGVPISSWVNNNPSTSECYLGGEEPISPVSGSYSTCEADEWYGPAAKGIRPDDYACSDKSPQGCGCRKSPDGDRLLTFADGNVREMGQDIVIDDDFPCDLWQEFFKLTWQQVKDSIPKDRVLSDCSTLDENSEGPYWITGGDCDIKGQIGGPKNAVFLISAVNTSASGGSVYGALMVTDVENSGVQFTGNGNATIYGAAIMDGDMKNFNGTFQIVWVDTLVSLAFNTPLFGTIAGGWTDFHAEWQ